METLSSAQHEVPKYEAIAREVRERILGGELRPGDRLETEQELCDRFGVSRGPIRQALAQLEQGRYIRRARGFGTVVCDEELWRPTARAVKRVGVLIDARSSYGTFGVSEGIHGFAEFSERLGGACRVSFEFHRLRHPEDAYAREFMTRGDFDGILVFAVQPPCIEFLAQLGPTDVPVVSFYRRIDNPALHHIYVDHQAASRSATEYLLQLGHRDIGIVVAAPLVERPDGRERLAGYQEALKAAGVGYRTDRALAVHLASRDVIEHQVAALLKAQPSLSAILVGGHSLAQAVVDGIEAGGRRIPEDLSVIFFDEPSAVRKNWLRPTIVTQPIAGAAARAMERLWVLMSGGDAEEPRAEAVVPELVIRESCAPKPAG